MLVRVGVLGIGLLVLGGCRGGAEQVGEPAAARAAEPGASAAPTSESVATPRPVLKPEPVVLPELGEPEADANAEPPDDDALPDGAIRVEGRIVAVRLEEDTDHGAPADSDEDPPPPARTLVVSIDGATTGDGLLSLPAELRWCDSTEAVIEPVPGEASPLVLAQAFCESGEDHFSREIVAAVIHVGGPTAAPRVLWQGKGSYSSTFGVCREIDVPVAKVTKPGTLVVEQHTEVVKSDDPDELGVKCKRKALKVRRVAELGF